MAGTAQNPVYSGMPSMSDPLVKNWMKAAYGFKYLRLALEPFVSNHIGHQFINLQQMVSQHSNNVQPCSVCTSNNLLPDHGTNGCNQKFKRDCFCRRPPPKRRPCPNNYCSYFYHLIVNDHIDYTPRWSCTDPSKWYYDNFQYAKCFFGSHCQATSLSELDVSGLLSVMINNRHIHQYIDNVNLFKKCRDNRNNIFHSCDYHITDMDLSNYIDGMIGVLEDKHTLIHDQIAKHCVYKLNELKKNRIYITEINIIDLVKQSETAINELSDNVKVQIKDRRKQALSEINKLHDKVKLNIQDGGKQALCNISKEHNKVKLDIQAQRNQVMCDISKKHFSAVSDIKAQKSSAVSDMQTQRNTAVSDIQAQRDSAVNDIEEHEDRVVRKIEESLEEINELKEEVVKQVTAHVPTVTYEDIQKSLIHTYRRRCRSLPVVPLFNNSERLLLDVYKYPTTTSVKHYGGRGWENNELAVQCYGDIFRKDNVHFEGIFVVGDAGVGKTVFCTRMSLLWYYAMCKKEDRPSGIVSKDLQKDIDYMSKFEFVFFVSLRDTCHTHIVDMIVEQMFGGNREKYWSIIDAILREKSTLVLIDGLDEWMTQQVDGKTRHELPVRVISQNCVYITTSRASKIESIRLSSKDMDHCVEIKGISGDSSESFVGNVISYMNEENSENRVLSDFMTDVKKFKLNDMLCIPIIASHLVVLWCEDHLTDMPRAMIYANILEMLLKRAEKKGVNVEPTAGPKDLQLPVTLTGLRYVNKHISLIYKICHLSFRSFFKQDTPASNLVFTLDQLLDKPYCFTEAEIDFFCKIGILSKSEVLGCHSVERLKLSFIHKSYLEFFAALFIASSDAIKMLENNWRSLDYVLNYKNVILLLVGLFPELGKVLFDNLYHLMFDELLACRKMELFRYDNSLYSNSFQKKIQSLQTLVVCCFKEVRIYKDPKFVPRLEDFIFDDSSNVGVLRQLLLLNKTCVKSIYSTNGRYQCEFDQVEKLQCLHIGKIASDDYLKFNNLILRNRSALHTLSIEGRISTVVPKLPIYRLYNLTSLSLTDMKLPSDILRDLVNFLTRNNSMENIKLAYLSVFAAKDSFRPYKMRLNLDLSNHKNLSSLCLEGVNISCDRVNSPILQSVSWAPVVSSSQHDPYKHSYSSNSRSFLISLRNSLLLEHLYIDGGNKLDKYEEEALSASIRSLKDISILELRYMKFTGNTLLQLHPEVKHAEISLLYVLLSLRCFRSFVDSFVRNRSSIKVRLFSCQILMANKSEHKRKLSENEAVDFMYTWLAAIPSVKAYKHGSELHFETKC